MSSRSLALLFSILALFAVSCGGSTEVAVDSDDGQAAVTETSEAAETTTEAPTEESSIQLDDGELDGMVIYEATCARCHGSDGSGGRGPNLQGIATEHPDTAFGVDIVNDGGRGMPSFTNSLSPEQIESVINYVWETF